MKEFWRKEDGKVLKNIIESDEDVANKFLHYICSIFSADYDDGSRLFCEGCLDRGRRVGS